MELRVSVEDLRKRKLFLATPMYGGQCAGMYTRSIADLTALSVKYGLEFKSYFLFNESLITRARNYCADEFLRAKSSEAEAKERAAKERGEELELPPDFTHLMFIDSDIGFDANDVIALLAMMSDESPYDVLCGPYPKKCISWEKIIQAVNRGAADEDANALDQFVGDFVFNPVLGPDSPSTIPISEPAEVLESGTGFMMIKRRALELYAKNYPELSYRPDHVRSEAFDGSREITAFFDTVIEPKSRRYLSEDYMFCQNVRNMGGKVWLAPWMKLQHVGSYIFGGSLQALASIGAAPTADPSKLKKVKKNEDKPRNTGGPQELLGDKPFDSDQSRESLADAQAVEDGVRDGSSEGGVPAEAPALRSVEIPLSDQPVQGDGAGVRDLPDTSEGERGEAVG